MTWGGLDEIFNPGVSHLHDELKRKRIEAQVPGAAAGGGRDSVDLDKGIVRLPGRASGRPRRRQRPRLAAGRRASGRACWWLCLTAWYDALLTHHEDTSATSRPLRVAAG